MKSNTFFKMEKNNQNVVLEIDSLWDTALYLQLTFPYTDLNIHKSKPQDKFQKIHVHTNTADLPIR